MTKPTRAIGPALAAELAAETHAVGEGFGQRVMADMSDGCGVEPAD